MERLSPFGSAATKAFDPECSDADFLVEFAPEFLSPDLRASFFTNPEPPADGGGSVPEARLRQVSAMAQHVRENHLSPLVIADIAAAVHLTPSHAMTVLRRTVGVTLGDYVTTCRVAEAQRLLLTTLLRITEIAEDAGVGSLSRFFEHVTATCGMTPREYRRQRR